MGTKREQKMVECQVCGHQSDAVFFKEDLDANDVEYCVVCGARDFKFIEFTRKTKKEGRGVEKR
jgi:hypothetical protein